MAKVEVEELPGEMEPIFLARRLDKAQAIEALLNELGIDYAVKVEPCQTSILGSLFGSYMGAYFLVASTNATSAREALLQAGHKKGLLNEGPDSQES